MIECKDLCFSYGKNPILSNITCTIDQGAFLGVIGPNGGGKTTFLKLLMGLLSPTSGSITIDSKSPYDFRTKIGYVPQLKEFDLQFPLTVLDLVLMGTLSSLTLWGSYPKESKEKALQYLNLVGLSDLKDKSFGELSGGQAQRALIARALCSEPELLLLDEPTAGIDPLAEEGINSLLQLLKGNMTILMVTHEISGLIDQVDEVICIQNSLTKIPKTEVCSHFALGLYHKKET